MRTFWRVAVPLLVGLAPLAWGATLVVNEAARTWFTRDVALRARVAAVGSQAALASHLASGDRRKLVPVLAASGCMKIVRT